MLEIADKREQALIVQRLEKLHGRQGIAPGLLMDTFGQGLYICRFTLQRIGDKPVQCGTAQISKADRLQNLFCLMQLCHHFR